MLKYIVLILFSLNAYSSSQSLKGNSKGDSTLSEKSDKDYLVEKLNYVHQMIPKNHKAFKSLQLRLAHSLSLRAEENFIKAEEEKCKPCAQLAGSDARKSLSIYKKMDTHLKQRHPFLHIEALFSQAYLYRFLGENYQSLYYLKRITQKKKGLSPHLKAKAYFNMGEIYFESYDYKKALQAFNEVLKFPKSPLAFKAVYRKIWSLSNLSFHEKALNELEKFLKSKAYSKLQLNLEEQKIKRKLESELIVLYGYAKVTDKRLKFLYSFSRAEKAKNSISEKNQRIFNLAQSLNRVGRAFDSNKAWSFYLSKAKSPKDQLKAYAFMLDNDFALNRKNLLEKTGTKVLAVFTLLPKANLDKKNKQSIHEKLMVFFERVNKKQNSYSKEQKKYLLTLYQKYNSVYPGHTGVLSRSAYLALDLKDYVLAKDLFQTAVLSLDSYKDQKISKSDMRESLSVKQMEVAELTEDKEQRMQAYGFYIRMGRDEKLVFKAKYQRAYIGYLDKDYKSANKLFKDLALYKPSQKESIKEIKDLQVKSAHLALSALDKMGKQEELLFHQSGIFIKSFPDKRQEFMNIYHAALLNTVQKFVSDKNFSNRPTQASSDKDIIKAWERLEFMFVNEATDKEKFNYHFNKLLLAKELLKFKEMDKSIHFLLADKNLEAKDRENILGWKLWLAELRFDFKEVLRLIKILHSDNQSEEHLLRLAHLVELTGEKAIPYYQDFIEKFPNSNSVLPVLNSLIEKSSYKDQKMLLEKYSAFFKEQPDLLVYLILKVDQGKLDDEFMNPFLKLSFMKDSSLTSFLQRKRNIEAFEGEIVKVKKYSLSGNSSSVRRSNQRLKNYMNQINQLREKVDGALKLSDWTSRVVILSSWKSELSRFYNSVINLPLPKGLTEEEKVQYARLLQEQMQTYKVQIEQIEKELNTLLSSDFLTNYKQALEQDFVFYKPLKWEMEKLIPLLEGANEEQMKILLSSVKVKYQSSKQVAKNRNVQAGEQTQRLYESLKKDPFDKESLVQLLELERAKDNPALSYYLLNRINELSKKNRWIKL